MKRKDLGEICLPMDLPTFGKLCGVFSEIARNRGGEALVEHKPGQSARLSVFMYELEEGEE